MHSIRAKIMVITLAVILVSMFSMLTAGYYTLQTESNHRSTEAMNLIAQSTKKSLENNIESIEQSVEMAANLAGDTLDGVMLVECGAAGTNAKDTERTAEQKALLDAYLAEYSAGIREAFSSVASHTHGVVTYYYCISPEISETEHGFFYSRVGKTGFEEQAPLDARELDPEDIEHTTWYYTPIKRGRPSWVGPYPAHFLGELKTYSYLVPIYKAGAFIGVLGMDIPFETLVNQISPIRVYESGYVCLIDEEGRLLYHPNLPTGSSPEEFGVTGLGEILRQENNGDQLITYQTNGQERQMAFSTMPNGMKVLVTAPSREINASGIRLTHIIIIATLAIIVVCTVLLLMIMRFITRPLQRLTEASEKLAAGDYDTKLDYPGRDEVGKLTESFKQMRDRQKSYIEDLNRQIYTDKLTGLPNMRGFFKNAGGERRRMLAEGRYPVMLYFNLSGMKHFNRQYGFEAGDRLICSLADILRRHFGRSVCRYSEDHFAAISDEENAERELQEIFDDFSKANSGNSLPVHVGIYPDRVEAIEASLACDRARFAGDQLAGSVTSGFCYFTGDMLKLGDEYRYIIRNLDRALKEGWVQVYYQPIIRATDNRVCDEEALSRWIDPVMGFLSPAAFIPALEESRLIYRLDLYVVEKVLEKMRKQEAAGLYLVPQSVNLSRMDFDSCDIVEEIRRRVDEAGLPRSMLTIEITESVIGSDFDFMKKQVERFRELGFPVWMDDFGSGYSSLDVLQSIRFDVIKFDMRFMQNFDRGDDAKVILTELMRMAIALGVETVCEGVETEEQVEFLREAGCTRIQGFYYCKPVPFEEILARYEKGEQIGFENPEESAYYTAIGRINLYDMAILATEDKESLRRYFDTLPMGILEVNGTQVKYIRCNKSYREFLQRAFHMEFGTNAQDYAEMPEGTGSVFMNAVIRCARDGNRMMVDEKIGKDTTAHTFIRRVAVNPVTGASAVAIAVLAVIREGEEAGANYAHIAKALSSDYVSLYYVNMETNQFVEYSPDPIREDLALERHGDDFFAASRADARIHLYKEDQEMFIREFRKENIEQLLDTQGTFTLTYRLMMEGVPTYVQMKAVRMQSDGTHLIVGVSNVDTQMRQKEAMDRIQAEQKSYSLLTALMQGCICIYTVDPETCHYHEYRSSGDYADLGLAREGDDFFAVSHQESLRHVYPEDVAKFQTMLTRERVMEEITKNGQFSFQYRMILEGEPKYVRLKAVLVEEADGPKLIVGISDIDSQVRKEQDLEQKLAAARSRANLDMLTGIRNRAAYDSMSEDLSHQIESGQPIQYAIVLFRVKNLAAVNETVGREAGDRLIRESCTLICETFKHSPVFRVAGDQFAAIAQGHDYEFVDSLAKELEAAPGDSGRPEIACGVAKYDGEESVTHVFERADALCRRA